MLKRRIVSAIRAFRDPPFVDAGHFYSPLLGRAEREAQARRGEAAPVARSLPGIDLDPDRQFALLESMLPGYADLPWSAGPDGHHRFHYENRNYEYSDAIFYAAVLRRFRPSRVIEIGSGFSSALAMDVNDLFLDGTVTFTFVEPYPDDRLLRLVGSDELGARLVAKRLQDVDDAIFAELGANDVLFIDSTHVGRAGSDVNHLIFDVLPMLAPGVLVHVHDVFHPFEYPPDWLRSGRGWNEAYLVRAFLEFNDAFEVVLFNTYLEALRPEWFEENMPLCLKNPGGSIWLRRR